MTPVRELHTPTLDQYSPTMDLYSPVMEQPNYTMSLTAPPFTPSDTEPIRSSRAGREQTTKYDDFVQYVHLEPGTYASDGISLYKLEETHDKATEQMMPHESLYYERMTNITTGHMVGSYAYYQDYTDAISPRGGITGY